MVIVMMVIMMVMGRVKRGPTNTRNLLWYKLLGGPRLSVPVVLLYPVYGTEVRP